MVRQLRTVFGPRVYEVTLPLAIGPKPLGDVRVGVSTVLLRSEVWPNLRTALLLSFTAIILATLSAGVVSFRVLRPLEKISQSVDLLARGEFSGPVPLKRSDEWGILSSKLHLLGEQMRGEKAAFVRLQENLDQIFSNLSDGPLLFDQQDRLVLSTPAAQRFLGPGIRITAQRPAMEVFSQDAPLHVDRDLIKQALLNLVLNGCQAMPQGGKLRQTVLWSALEANHGQTDAGVRLPARGGGFTIFLTADEAVLTLKKSSDVASTFRSARVRVAPTGACPDLVGRSANTLPALRCCGSSRSFVLIYAKGKIGKRSGKAAGPESGSRATIFLFSPGGRGRRHRR